MPTTFITALGKGEDSLATAEQTAAEAMSKLNGKTPDLVLVFCGSKYDCRQVVRGIRNAAGRAPLIGCSTAGEFTESGVSKNGIAVGMICSDEAKFFLASAGGLKEDPYETMRRVVSQLPGGGVPEYPHLSAILLHDGLAGKGEETVLSAAAILGMEFKFFGGSAGDDLKFEGTYTFFNDTVAANSVAICLIAAKKPFFTGVRHGHTPLSRMLTITKAVDNILYTIDDRPAWEVWLECALEEGKKAGYDPGDGNDASKVGAFLIAYELGLDIGEEMYKVRVPLSKNADGSLNFACSIPEGATFRIMKSSKADQIASARSAAELATAQAADATKVVGALIFDCVCRGIILGDDFHKSVEAIQAVVGDIPLLGFETYGEICMDVGQFSGYHNTTTVVVLIPE